MNMIIIVSPPRGCNWNWYAFWEYWDNPTWPVVPECTKFFTIQWKRPILGSMPGTRSSTNVSSALCKFIPIRHYWMPPPKQLPDSWTVDRTIWNTWVSRDWHWLWKINRNMRRNINWPSWIVWKTVMKPYNAKHWIYSTEWPIPSMWNSLPKNSLSFCPPPPTCSSSDNWHIAFVRLPNDTPPTILGTSKPLPSC